MPVSVEGVNPPSDMPPAKGRRAERKIISKADSHISTRIPKAFLNLWVLKSYAFVPRRIVKTFDFDIITYF